MDKAPRPVKIVMFLLFLLLFGAFIPFMLHTFGVHCNTDGEVVKTSSLDVLHNIQIAFIDPTEQTNITSFYPEKIGLDVIEDVVGTNCYFEVCHVEDNEFYTSGQDECDNKTLIYPFLDKKWSWERCITCDGDVNFSYIYRDFIGAVNRDYYCFGDAYAIDYDEMGWIQKLVCKPNSRCMPPEHYYYDYSSGLFTCQDLDICGVNATNNSITYRLDDYLKSAGAELMYGEESNNDYKRLLYFKCSKDANPNLTLYGIPIFDYKIWLVLMVIAGMFLFLRNIKRH